MKHGACICLQICLMFALVAILASLFVTRCRLRVISLAFLGDSSWSTNKTPPSVYWGRAVDDGRWYNFSRPPLFVFFVYSAFLVDHGPQDVIQLISVSSPVRLFARRQLDVFCVVRHPDEKPVHVASILHRPPLQITEPGRHAGYVIGDYVYSCPVPRYRHQHDRVRNRQ